MTNFINFHELTFTAWPEMIAWPYLILKGWLPYRDIAIAHNPLLIVVLTLFYKLVGVGVVQLKIFTWSLIALNSYLTYYVCKKYWANKISIASAVLYILLCITFQGNGLWFDIALTPFALLLYYFIKEKKYLYSGIIFALGFLTKQTFIYFLIPVFFVLFNQFKFRIKEFINFIIGSGIILLIFTLILMAFGIADDYWNWAIKFGVLYLPQAEGQVLLPTLKQFVFAIAPFALFIFDVSLLPWSLVGILGVYPRWELFHLQPALPFIAITLSSFIFSNRNKVLKGVLFSGILAYLFVGIYRSAGDNIRFYESDVQKVASKVTDSKYGNIYVINYWDNIYAFTNTLPAVRPLIPYIPWYLTYGEDKKIITNDLKANIPDAVIIGERDTIFPEIYSFVDRFYTCNIVEKKVELCVKNK